MKQKQLNLFTPPPRFHGGSEQSGRRKTARPLTTQNPMHFVFRSDLAKGKWSFLLRDQQIKEILYRTARRFQVKILHFANVGNHFHCLAQGKTRDGLKNFLRVFPQAISFLVTGTKKGNALREQFWKFRPFSRIVFWGRDFFGTRNYVERNRLEGTGMPRDVVDFRFAEMMAEANTS